MQVRTCSSLSAYLLVYGWCTFALAQAPANRVTGPIDDTRVTTLLGNVHPMARAEFDQGVVNAETPLQRMVFQLEPSIGQQAALDALVEAQHDPQSPLYHQWLKPDEYGARFGASVQDLARITGWLAGHGFTVNEIPISNRQLIFSGTAGQVEDTFHTEIHHYMVGGVSHIANTQDPQIPSALAGVVGGIVSLHDFRSVSQIRSRMALDARPQYTSGNTHYLFPADWATIYELNPLYKAGISGAGTTIAIVGRSNINLQDVIQFRSTSGLAANKPSVILVSTNPGLVSGDQDEATLDAEWSGGVAPEATVKFVVGASSATTDGVDLSAQYIVNHATAPVMSTSYESCEADMGAAEISFYNSLWQQAASEGISSFVSSGDSGAAGCYGGSSSSASGMGVNGLCSSPYSTCVGGTEFKEGSTTYWSSTNGAGDSSALSYIPEEVWNESGTNGGSGLWSSGGGASLWQKGISGISAGNGMRTVPDVAMSASGPRRLHDHREWFLLRNRRYVGCIPILCGCDGAGG
jgi:pseudomonalisin